MTGPSDGCRESSAGHEGVNGRGVTSDSRVADVLATGLFSAVVGYSDLDLSQCAPSGVVLVDLGGRWDVRERVRQALAPRPVRTLLVGATHGGGLQPQSGEEVFLAPDRMRLRAADWGAAGLAEHLQQAWQRHLQPARSEVQLLLAGDREAVERVYAEVRLGRCPLQHGHLLALPDDC